MVSDDYLLKLFEEYDEDRRDFSDREWETIKFFTTVFAALLTATIAIIKLLFQNYEGLWMFIPLPFFMFVISYIGLRNFKRECARLFERVATLMKIEEKIGFHDKRNNRRRLVLKCDEYYLSKSFIEIGKKYDNTKEFVDEMIKNPPEGRYGNTYKIFKILFIAYMGISIFMIIIMILLNLFALQ
jgi:hypothetical protein